MRRKSVVWIVGVVAVLVAVRAALPVAIQWYVNRTLDRADGYAGSVGDVDLALIRGAYQIDDVRIQKVRADVPVPFFSAETVDLSIQWGELLHGHVVGEAAFERPVLNFVRAPPEAGGPVTGTDADWNARLDALVPFGINRLEVRQGRIHYRDYQTQPQVDVRLHDVNGVARDLAIIEEHDRKRSARLDVTASTQGHGRLDLQARLDPRAEALQLDLDGMLRDVELTRLNEVFRAYLNVEVESGTLSVGTQVRTRDGRIHGYVKPLLHDVDVVDLEEELEEGLLDAAWEATVGLFGELLRNQPREQLGARIPLRGDPESPRIQTWSALASGLRNAYVDALRLHLEELRGNGSADAD